MQHWFLQAASLVSTLHFNSHHRLIKHTHKKSIKFSSNFQEGEKEEGIKNVLNIYKGQRLCWELYLCYLLIPTTIIQRRYYCPHLIDKET